MRVQHADNNSQATGGSARSASLVFAPRMNPSLTRSLSALVMAQGAVAVAQDNAEIPAATSSGTNAPSQLPDVVVSGEADSFKPESVGSPRYTEPVRDIPQTITVIPQAVMQSQNATTLRDVLRNTPGISMQAGEGGVPAGDNLSIRGFSARTDLFVDGMRDLGGYSRDVFNVEQVDIVKGPASTYTGRGSTGGSVNLVTKTPRMNDFYGGSLGFGTDEYLRGTVDMNQPLNSLGLSNSAVRLNLLYHENDTPGRDFVENQRWGIAPSLAFGLGTPTRLIFTYMHLDQDNRPDYGIPWVPNTLSPATLANYGLDAGDINHAPPVSFRNFYGLKSDYETTRTDILNARVEHDFNDVLTLREQLRFGMVRRDSVITAPRFNTATNLPAAQAINRQAQGRDQYDTIYGSLTDLLANFETGPVEHSTVTGLELTREEFKNYGRAFFSSVPGPATAPFADLYNPNPNADRFGNLRRNGNRNEATADTLSLYAFDTLKVGEHWEFTAGVRWDHFDVEAEAFTPSGSTTLQRTDDMVNWKAGVVYKPVEQGSVYFGFGTSANPSAEGLVLSTNLNNAANINLPPEETRSYELGTKWDLFDARLSASFALFRTEKFNARTIDPVDSTDVIALNGEQVVQGIELGLAGRITRNWQVFAGYAYMDSEITKSDNPLEAGARVNNTPEHSFNLWTTYRLPFNLEIGGGAFYTGERLNPTAPPNTRTAPDYWTFDAMAAYHINRNVSIQLNVYNLADEEYIDRVGGGHFVPGPGRSATLTASFTF